MGARLTVAPRYTSLPVALRLGVSQHLVWVDFVSGGDQPSAQFVDRTEHYASFDVGGRLALPVRPRIEVAAEILAPVLTTDARPGERIGAVHWTLGASYALR